MKILILTILLLPFYSFAQKDTIISFSEVVLLDSMTQNQLFQNARHWYNNTFKSSKEVLQIVDKETGELSGKGLLRSYYDFNSIQFGKSYVCYYRFNIEIKVRENKYRYEFTNFIIDEVLTPAIGVFPVMTSSSECPKRYPGYGKAKTDGMYLSMKTQLESEMNVLINSLKQEMAKRPTDDF